MSDPPRRKGARSRAEIPPRVLKALNRGEDETATLVEILAIDTQMLLRTVAPQIPRQAVAELDPELGIVRRMEIGGQLLAEHLTRDEVARLAAHRSDVVRAWTAYAFARRPNLKLAQRLKLVRPLADDPNSGVREWAWMSLRPHVAADLDEAFDRLRLWTGQRSPNLRRFAVEITRPRGVWCLHLDALKQEPQRGLPLLDPLRAEPHKYVQDSVANWLNDAAKTRPGFVRDLCRHWRQQSGTPQTERICKRALRTCGE